MKRPLRKAIILAIGAAAFLMSGCEETLREEPAPEEPKLSAPSDPHSDIQKHRLIAMENRQLKEKLEQLEPKIRKQYEERLTKLKKQLNKCRLAKEALEKPPEEQEKELNLVNQLFEDNSKLAEENEKLQAQIEQLEARVQELEQ